LDEHDLAGGSREVEGVTVRVVRGTLGNRADAHQEWPGFALGALPDGWILASTTAGGSEER
jgi:hypothetical protein